MANFLKDPENYEKKKRTGRPELFTKREKRSIKTYVKRNKCSARKAWAHFRLTCSVDTVRRFLRKDANMVWTKMKKGLMLTQQHKERRLKWAEAYHDYGEKWQTVIFSDEKKFNLDGPDGCKYYWHDLKEEREVQFSRQSGGGGFMIWAGISYQGKTELIILNGKQNAAKYCQTLDTGFVPFWTQHFSLHACFNRTMPLSTLQR